jgi:hypothetical protein
MISPGVFPTSMAGERSDSAPEPGYDRQNRGRNSTSTVNSSSRPSSMPADKQPFRAVAQRLVGSGGPMISPSPARHSKAPCLHPKGRSTVSSPSVAADGQHAKEGMNRKKKLITEASGTRSWIGFPLNRARNTPCGYITWETCADSFDQHLKAEDLDAAGGRAGAAADEHDDEEEGDRLRAPQAVVG